MATKQDNNRRKRDPETTRAAILEAAKTVLARDGAEGLSVSTVAKVAGVNRGTAYQHFKTRDKLVAATAAQVSDKLFNRVFGDPDAVKDQPVETVDIAQLTDRLTSFAVENPELCRIWLLQVLASPDPLSDPFWRQYEGSLARFAQTELAEEGIDSEVFALMQLAGAFLWPVWARTQAMTLKERTDSSRRMSREYLRLSLYGTLKADHYPEIAERLDKDRAAHPKLRAVKKD